jgi:hypothetical protein
MNSIGQWAKLAIATLVILLTCTTAPAHWPHDGPTGRYNLLILRIDFSDAPGILYSTTEFRDVWAPQIEQYFEEASNDNLDLHITNIEPVITLQERYRYHWMCNKVVPILERPTECRHPREAVVIAEDLNYIVELPQGLAPPGGTAADVFDGILLVFGAPLDFPYETPGPYGLPHTSCGSNFRAISGSPQCVGRIDGSDDCEDGFASRYSFMVASEDGDGSCTTVNPITDVGPAMHEVGHSITSHNNNDNGDHPADYRNGFELLDSCYPCETGAFTRASDTVKGPGYKQYFPGWLDDSKIVSMFPPTGGTEVLEPIESDPDTATSPMALRVQAADITAYWVECRRLIGPWDGGTPIYDEGVVILHSVPYTEQETTFMSPMINSGFCDGDGIACTSHADCSGHGGNQFCVSFTNAWEPGEIFYDAANDITISVGPDVGNGCTVTVDYGPPGPDPGLSLAGVPDIGMTPWLTPPNRTWETIDIWVDSSCNRYEADGGVLRYGRDMNEDVIDNGDDACANEWNRIYARVRNYGSAAADDVVVDFYVTDPLGVGIRDSDDWTMVGTADKTTFPAELTSIPPFGDVVVWVPWLPMVPSPPEGVVTFPFHSCLQVKMHTVAGERLISNQDGEREQENIGHFEVRREISGSYEVVERSITLTNTENDMRMFTIHPTTDIPPGWDVDIGGGQSLYWLNSFETVEVPVRISVPATEPLGQRHVVKIKGLIEERTTDTTTGELLHWSWHHVGGAMLVIQTVERSTLSWEAKAEPPDTCNPQVVTADGCLTPALNGEPIAVTYLEPSGAQTTNVTFTDSSGCFSDAHLPGGGGQIRVSALWQGNLTASSVADMQVVSAANPGDLDCDQFADGNDNCDAISNPGQIDFDGDGFGDLCDCAIADSGAWAVPNEIGNLNFASKTNMVWDPGDLQAGDDTVYEVVRGAVIDLPVAVDYNETCLVTMVDAPAFEAIEIPNVGETATYLVRGVNTCGTGTLGRRSSSLERQTIVTCPTCAHDKCDSGSALDPACDDCVQLVCNADPFCCDTQWDSFCEQEIRTVCGSLVCDESQGTCPHTLCTEGTPLGNSCDAPPAAQSCVDLICASDPYCCGTLWDDVCVGEVESICGNNCH